MSILSVIKHLRTGDGAGAGSYTVTRTAAGTLVLGRSTPGATSSFSIEAVVQPLNQRELQVVPEGRRATDVRSIHTATALRADPWGPDVVTIGGEAYAVYSVGRFELRGTIAYRCYAARQVVP